MTTPSKEGVQGLRGTSSQLTSSNRILKAGETGYITDKDRAFFGDGSTYGKNRPVLLDSSHEAYIAGVDRLYEGKDLTEVHSAVITSSYSGNPWAWIKARIQAHNFEGIHVGDYIPVAVSAGTITDGDTAYSITAKTLNAKIAGIDTYYNYGDSTTVGHHIDFITETTIGTTIPYNKTNHNNGTSTYQCPFLASKIYACLNGIDNTGLGYEDVTYGYDASSGGVLQLLPSALQNVIVGKRVFAPKRYSASGHLTEANGREWETWGGLWLPTEVEVYGYPINATGGVEASSGICNELAGGLVQYPIFAGAAGKTCGNRNKNRVTWWLASVASGSTAHACYVNGRGLADAGGCTGPDRSVPVCFRIS